MLGLGFRPRHALAVAVAALCTVGAAPATAAAPTQASTSASAAAPAVPSAPAVAAKAVEVLDARSGQVLYARNAQTRIPPASLVKMMTFDLALKAIAAGTVQPATMVPVGLDAWHVSLNQAVSRMYLLPNVPVSMQNLLIGLMVPSGNDAAVALADYLGGSVSGFVAKMNAEAARLGLAGTHYTDASGLAAGQYTTAADVAALARHIWTTYPNFDRYTNHATFTWDHITQRNYNHLVGTDPRVTGLKSGYLQISGYHLVATASQGNTQIIAVVLGTATLQDSADEDELLLNWAFSHYHDVQVDWGSHLPSTVRVWKGRAGRVRPQIVADPWLTVPSTSGAAQALALTTSFRNPLSAPLTAGQQIGLVRVTEGGALVATLPVRAAVAVPRGRWLHVLWDGLRLHFWSVWHNHLHL